MGEVIATSIAIKLGLAIAGYGLALTAAWFGLRLFDRAGQIDFIASLDRIEQDPRAAAEYFGRRFMGVCLGAAFVVGVALAF